MSVTMFIIKVLAALLVIVEGVVEASSYAILGIGLFFLFPALNFLSVDFYCNTVTFYSKNSIKTNTEASYIMLHSMKKRPLL